MLYYSCDKNKIVAVTMWEFDFSLRVHVAWRWWQNLEAKLKFRSSFFCIYRTILPTMPLLIHMFFYYWFLLKSRICCTFSDIRVREHISKEHLLSFRPVILSQMYRVLCCGIRYKLYYNFTTMEKVDFSNSTAIVIIVTPPVLLSPSESPASFWLYSNSLQLHWSASTSAMANGFLIV